MKKRLIFSLLVICLTLSSCSLAVDGASAGREPDRLIGVFITTEHLDLFDMEAYLNDHVSQLHKGGELFVENSSGYNKRLYANMENGDCVFEGLDGILFASYRFEEETHSGYRNAPGIGISDGEIILNETGGIETMEIQGTLFVSDNAGDICFYYNPVYQDSDGNVYLVAGTGMFSDVTEGVKTSMMHTLFDEFEINSDGETIGYQADVRISVESLTIPEKYVIISADENHCVLSREEFAPDQIPEEVHPAEGAAYLLIESHSTLSDGSAHITRSIHSAKDELQYLDIFVPTEGMICTKGTVRIVW